MLILKKLTNSFDVFIMLKGIELNEKEFKNETYNMTYDEFKKWVEKMNSWSIGKNLPIGYVKQNIYILYLDNIPIGIGKLRHKLTKKSRIEGGNIGYAIAKQYRGLGYGKQLFNLLLEKSRELGIKEILATVRTNNQKSKNVVECCGGKLIKETDDWLYYNF